MKKMLQRKATKGGGSNDKHLVRGRSKENTRTRRQRIGGRKGARVKKHGGQKTSPEDRWSHR